MPSNHLILYRPLLLLPSIFPSIRVFSNESVLHIRWPEYWSLSFIISLCTNKFMYHATLSPRSGNNVGFPKVMRGRGVRHASLYTQGPQRGPTTPPSTHQVCTWAHPSLSVLGQLEEADTRDQEAWSYSDRPQRIQGREHAEKENLLEQRMRV